MCSSWGGSERETLRKIRCSFQPARNPPHHTPSAFRGVVCLMPYVPRNFADVLLCVASRQQGLGDIASQIGTYCNECSSRCLNSKILGRGHNLHSKGLLYSEGGPNMGPSRYQNKAPTALERCIEGYKSLHLESPIFGTLSGILPTCE